MSTVYHQQTTLNMVQAPHGFSGVRIHVLGAMYE